MKSKFFKKTKIMLLNPPLKKDEIYASYYTAGPLLAPLGICYLASVLEKNGYEVKLIDSVAEGFDIDQIIRQISTFQPQVVGITLPTVSFYSAAQLASSIKLNYKDIFIIVGGPHASALPFQTLSDCSSFDIAVFGEGELTFLEIIERYEKGNLSTDLKEIKGITYRKNGKILLNPPRPLIENLDELPYPARHLLPDINLYNTNLSIGERKPLVHIVPSRGCPFECIFCDQSVFGKRWRCFSAEYIVSEIEFLVERYAVKTVQFQDDIFTLFPERVIKFCRLLKEKRFDLTWNISSRVNTIDGSLFEVMRDAGCNIIYLGIESGDEEILKILKKGHKIKQVRDTVTAAKRAGLRVHGSFMLGNPGETRQSIERTIKFALSLPLDAASFFITTPYPNTELARIASQYGRIMSQNWNQYRGHPGEAIFVPFGLNSDYLLKKQKSAYRRFFSRLRIILDRIRKIRNLEILKTYLSGINFLFRTE